jgi:3'(2'), 5'-bisphosphate nucleotidase
MTPSPETEKMISLALAAGAAIMDIYATEFKATSKTDTSPVTEADIRAEAIILKGLAQHWPDIPVIAEESVAAGRVPPIGAQFFLVDPLDGTKEFISKNGEFTVNIALVQNGTAVKGIVYAPALRTLYWGEVDVGAGVASVSSHEHPPVSWQQIQTRKLPIEGATVLASRSHRDAATDAFLKTVKVAELIGAGSSLKFCIIAEGIADLYPRFGRTMEWDTAAGHAVLAAAGGRVTCADGTPFLYGKSGRGFDNPAFIAQG